MKHANLITVAKSLAVFQAHLLENVGKPIGLATVSAFSKMVDSILKALAPAK